MPALDKVASETAINKAIKAIGTSATKLNKLIHNAGVLCIQHALDHGDCTLAARLVDALPKSHRRGLLIKWFITYSPISIAKDAKTGKMKAHLKGPAEERVWNVEGAKVTPFHDMPGVENEPDVPTYAKLHENVLNFINRSIKQAEKIQNVGEKRRATEELTAMRAVVTGQQAIAA